jgi:trigger factor
MEITQTAVEGLKHQFTVVLSASDIDAKVDHRLNELAGQVRLPGFRPGKVPFSLLKKRFGDSVLGEVVERAVTDSSQQAIEERGLKPALQPKIELKTFEKGKDLEFTMALEVLPEIEPIDFGGLKLERLVAKVSDDEVEKTLERLANEYRKTEPAPAEQAAAKGNVLVIDYKGSIDGEAFPGGTAEGHYLELGSNQFIPGFEEQLEGLKAGEAKTISVSFPADYRAEKLAGKQASFEVTVKEVRLPAPGKVDDELAKTMGVEDLEALRKTVRGQLEKQYGDISKNRLKRALLDLLAERHRFAVPEGMVEIEFEQIWRQLEETKKSGEIDPEDAAKSEDELKADYRSIAERRVRLGLLLSEVGRQQNINVPTEEMNRAMIEEARRHPGQERQVLDFFKNTPGALAQLRAPLFEAKVVDFILELAKPTEKDVSLEELMKDPDEAVPEKKSDAAAPKKKKGKA